MVALQMGCQANRNILNLEVLHHAEKVFQEKKLQSDLMDPFALKVGLVVKKKEYQINNYARVSPSIA